MIETWLPVVGYEGCYEVSDFGQVRSLSRHVVNGLKSQRLVAARVLSQGVCKKSGYRNVNLCRGDKCCTVRVHILVLEAFTGPRPGGGFEFHGCHRDGDASNNCLDNLKWGTPIENSTDKIAHGTVSNGEANGQAKLSVADVLEIRRRSAGSESQTSIAKAFGVGSPQIHRIIKRERWAHV